MTGSPQNFHRFSGADILLGVAPRAVKQSPLVSTDSIEEILAPFWRTDDGRTAAERAEAYGIDLSLLWENLRLTPEQRIDQNQAAFELVTALQKARA
jgi:hypothetical protein